MKNLKKPNESKACASCQESLPLSKFYSQTRNGVFAKATYYSKHCKKCLSVKNKAAYAQKKKLADAVFGAVELTTTKDGRDA